MDMYDLTGSPHNHIMNCVPKKNDLSLKSSCAMLFGAAKSAKALMRIKAVKNKTSLKSSNHMYSGESGHDVSWQCWQCKRVEDSGESLAVHLKGCTSTLNSSDILGCPFCPKDAHQSSDCPFTSVAFNDHMRSVHSDVSFLTCGYCLQHIDSPWLEDLSSHVISEHRLPWRPSPTTLSYLRRDNLPHRVVTCLGCGWCAFVLYANNAAESPASLESHFDHCSLKGGQVHLRKLTAHMCTSKVTQRELKREADQISLSFSQRFPLARGFQNDNPPGSADMLSAEASGVKPLRNVSRKRSSPIKQPIPKKPRPNLPKAIMPATVDKRVSFDVPLTLPPIQPSSKNTAKRSPTCLYVCPLCGDNALASLRERDEHLQSSHNGELVFPCQVCGLAYPLYIALRRHAVLKHNSDYDLVRYGPTELLESEPIECPECQLVVFADIEVLQLHLTEVHKMDSKRAKSLLRPKLPKTNEPTTGKAAGCETRRRVTREPKSEPSRPRKDRTASARGELTHTRIRTLSRLERMVAEVSGQPSAASCRLCRTSVHNPKELFLHMELDHSQTEEECEQLGCQACCRIFFGRGGRIDLIGHLRVLHQDADHASALSCPNAEPKRSEDVTREGELFRVRPCEALFSSPRLRQLHSSNSRFYKPSGFSCPLALELPDFDAESSDLPEQIRVTIMATETVADREGLMILAYCCPNCSRLFAGSEAPLRFASHRLECSVDNKPIPESASNPAVPAGTPENRPPSMLESVLRQDPGVQLKR